MTFILHDVVVVLKYSKTEYRCTKIIDDKDTKVLYQDKENVNHETSIDDVKYFKNITTRKKMDFYRVCDDADAYLSPQELIDVEEYVKTSPYRKLYPTRLADFKHNFALFSTEDEKLELETLIRKRECAKDVKQVHERRTRSA